MFFNLLYSYVSEHEWRQHPSAALGRSTRRQKEELTENLQRLLHLDSYITSSLDKPLRPVEAFCHPSSSEVGASVHPVCLLQFPSQE